MTAIRCGMTAALGIVALCLTGPAGAQESLDRGKSPAQLFASDCAICHKSPKGLVKSGATFGLDNFLRQHYTASRETAASIASYLRAMDSGPASPARSSKGSAKGGEKKPETKSGSVNGSEPKSSEPGSSEPGSPESKPTEPKPAEPNASTPAAGEAKPTEGGKSERSE